MRRMVLAAMVLMPSLVFGQSLGEVARKEKERRKQSAQKAKEYTQDDLKALPPVQVLAPAEGGKGTAPRTATTRSLAGGSDSGSDARQADEARWRQRAAEARERVEKARKEYETLSGMSIVPGMRWVDENERTVFGNVGELRAAAARAKADLTAAEQALERLEEDARRRNIPPGWLR